MPTIRLTGFPNCREAFFTRDAAFCREFAAGCGYPHNALRHCSKLMAAMQSQLVNPSVGSGDGDAATDRFKDGVIHAVRVEVLVSGRPVGW